MSNALGGVAIAAASRPSGGELSAGPMQGLLAAGICALAVWVFVRILRPGKFLLRRVPARPNRIHVLHVLAIFLIWQTTAFLAVSAVAAASGVEIGPGIKSPPTVVLPAMVLGQLVLVGATLAVAATTFRGGLRRGLGLSGRHWLNDVGRGGVGFLAVLPLCFGVLALTKCLIEWKVLPIEPTKHPFLEFLPTAAPGWVGVVVIGTVVLAPVAEELFFRGLVQSMLRRYLGGAWPAILITSALFAAAHAPQPQDVPALFVLAVALGYNYERTGRLVSPILIHALFNAVNIWAALSR